MSRRVKTEELFSTKNKYIRPFLDRFEYPYDAIPHINEYINELLLTRINDYFFMDDDILMGENVRISPLAVIKGPAIIGANTEICAGAIINGNVIIGENCVIGNSTEIRKSVICDGVRLPHYNYVFNSILGDNVVLGASANCADNNSAKEVGAVLGDQVNIGCGCVLNCGTVVEKGVTVAPLNILDGVSF